MAANRPPPRPTPLVPVHRGDRKSHDNLELVLAQEQHERRERELLAKLAEEQQARVDAERKAADTERRAQHAPARNESIAPKVESGAIDIRGRVTLQQFVTTLAALGALAGTAINYFRTQPPPPTIVDNSAPIREMQATISKQSAEIEALRAHAKASEDWTANAVEAACVDVVRPSGARSLPEAPTSSLNIKRRCPAVKLDAPQPVLP